jgi:hypothetical protein
MKSEKWKKISEFDDYLISNQGRVYSLINRKILKPQINGSGYYHVSLSKSGKSYTKRIHKLVAHIFMTNPLNLSDINHKNGIKTDNNVNNLEWTTSSQNHIHARRILNIQMGGVPKPIIGINIKTKEKIYFKSMQEAERNGFNEGAISLCCNKRLEKYKGYVWNLINDKENETQN